MNRRKFLEILALPCFYSCDKIKEKIENSRNKKDTDFISAEEFLKNSKYIGTLGNGGSLYKYFTDNDSLLVLNKNIKLNKLYKISDLDSFNLREGELTLKGKAIYEISGVVEKK